MSAARERARREAEDEYRRLLYVAMTRAIDRLVVCGADGERARPEGCWWNLVFEALKPPVSVEEPADDGDGKVWRYRKTPPSAGKTFAAAAAVPTDERPSWLDRDAKAEPPPVRPLSPALAYDEATPVRASASGSRGERDKALGARRARAPAAAIAARHSASGARRGRPALPCPQRHRVFRRGA